jgi:hypothetical protein
MKTHDNLKEITKHMASTNPSHEINPKPRGTLLNRKSPQQFSFTPEPFDAAEGFSPHGA